MLRESVHVELQLLEGTRDYIVIITNSNSYLHKLLLPSSSATISGAPLFSCLLPATAPELNDYCNYGLIYFRKKNIFFS